MIKSFLMIGQSNMAGRGEFEDIKERVGLIQCKKEGNAL